MSGSTSIDHDSREARRYEIRLKGHLDDRWAVWFDGLSLSVESDGTTTIRGSVVDQAALHGLLQRVRDTGLQLVSVTPTEPDQPQIPAAEPRQDRQITKEIPVLDWCLPKGPRRRPVRWVTVPRPDSKEISGATSIWWLSAA